MVAEIGILRGFVMLLTKLDMFGKKVEFTIDGKRKFQTFVGGILIFMLFCTGVLSFWYFGDDIFLRKNPNFIVKDEFLDNYPKINVTYKNFFFAIRLEDDNGGYIDDPRYFEPLFEYNYYIKGSTKSLDLQYTQRSKLVKCNHKMLNTDNKTYTKEMIDTFLCPEDLNYKIGGEWTDTSLGLITFYIRKCDETTEFKYNITCASKEEMTKKYNNLFYVGIKYHDTTIDPLEYENAVKKIFQYKFYVLDLNSRRQVLFQYTYNNIRTDIDPISSKSYQDRRDFLQFYLQTSSSVSNDEEIYIAEIPIYVNKLSRSNLRSYIKLQDIAANVGGILSFFYGLVNLLYNFYINNEFNYYMYNRLYTFFSYEYEQWQEDEVKREMEKTSGPRKSRISLINLNKIKDDILKKEEVKKEETKCIEIDLRGTTNREDSVFKDSLRVGNNLSLAKQDSSSRKGLTSVNELHNNPSKFYNKYSIKNIIEMKLQDKILFEEQSKPKSADVENRNTVKKSTTKTFKKSSVPPNLDKTAPIKKSNLKQEHFTLSHLWCYTYCLSSVKAKDKKQSIIRNQILIHANRDYSNKIDVLKFFKRMDQLELLTKIVMNSNQEFMLANRRKKYIYNEFPFIDKNYDEIFEFLENNKLSNLRKYLQTKNDSKSLDDVDKSLYELLEDDIKKKLDIKIDVERNEDEALINDLETLAKKIVEINPFQLNESDPGEQNDQNTK